MVQRGIRAGHTLPGLVKIGKAFLARPAKSIGGFGLVDPVGKHWYFGLVSPLPRPHLRGTHEI